MKKLSCVILCMWYLLSANTTFAFTHADTLRGGNGPAREWWDVKKYSLVLAFDTITQSISGTGYIDAEIIKTPCDSIQIDLQEPMTVSSVSLSLYGSAADNGMEDVQFYRDGNICWITGAFSKIPVGEKMHISIEYSGSPRRAVNPPWDGGFSWKRDSTGKPWIAVSCQGLGASVWWPCKDVQWDEPDSGMDMRFSVPEGLTAVSNGRLMDAELGKTGLWKWHVANPINNYDVSFYIGDYVHWSDTLVGEKGRLDLDYWVLRYNEGRARTQFAVVKQMLHCFEYWMGPYPFYEDGYKLVDAPYLGMEHQGAVAYGNKYKMGYLGFDRTGTDIGMNFDYIIIHESGHEWFGNNVTAMDMADNWIHEGITTYSESLFAECLLGKDKGQEYCRGEWKNIANDKPMIGPYGVNEEGSNDIYDKGTALMYMIRTITNDDEKFRQMLRGLGKEFYHQTVTTKQAEDYISAHTGLDLTSFFNQYLRTTDIPVLEYKVNRNKLNYRFSKAVAGFSMPITVNSGDAAIVIKPTTEWQTTSWHGKKIDFSNDFLIKVDKQ